MEASLQSNWIALLIEELGHEVHVINPRQLQLISQSMCKTDRNDARILARVGRIDLGLLRPTYRHGRASLKARALLNARRNLVQVRTRLVNSIRGCAKVFGYALRSGAVESFETIAARGLPAELLVIVKPQLECIAYIAKQIDGYDKEIERLGTEEFPQTNLLRAIHGVGPQVSLAFVAAIEDPKRFKRSRDVGPYFGLTPRRDQSGDKDPLLPISKNGDGSLRSLLVTAATHILRKSAPDSDLKRHGQHVAKRKTSKDRGRARIAVARKLAVVMHHLLLTGEVYEPLRNGKEVGS
jgi:transposase